MKGLWREPHSPPNKTREAARPGKWNDCCFVWQKNESGAGKKQPWLWSTAPWGKDKNIFIAMLFFCILERFSELHFLAIVGKTSLSWNYHTIWPFHGVQACLLVRSIWRKMTSNGNKNALNTHYGSKVQDKLVDIRLRRRCVIKYRSRCVRLKHY